MSAPDVSMPNTPDQSTLSSVVGGTTPQMPSTQSPGSPQEQDMNDATSGPQAPQGGRLKAIMQAVASVGSTALAGVPAGRRPSFVGGLGQGARAEQQAQAVQQDIKFKTFDDQNRAAQLHNQDLEMQSRVQEQQDKHEEHMQTMQDHADANDWGVQYDTIANHGDAVMDHLKTQTQANGAAAVPPGTHISPDGKTINIPQQTPENDAAMLREYTALAPAFNLPKSPAGATKLAPAVTTVFYNLKQGYDAKGDVYTADKLPGIIASNQSKLDDLNTNGGTPAQVSLIKGIIAKQNAQLDADNAQASKAAGGKKGAEVTAENEANTTPSNIAGQAALSGAKAGAVSNAEQANKIALQNNAAKESGKDDALVVAYDPNQQNPDGSKGGNTVMPRGQARQNNLTSYKADPATINSTIGGFNDVQTKINMLASVANDPARMSKVQGPLAAAMLEHSKGITFGAFGTSIDTSRINAGLYAEDVAKANQATRDYVVAMGAAHEAITQLPRLQTFGKSSRMTQQQMEAAQKMLPQPGDDAGMAAQKMDALQTTLDPLRKQLPTMQGAALTPSWKEQTQQAGGSTPQTQQAGGSTPQTHTFSLGAWQRANPKGDTNAAKTAAQKAGYTVVQ